MGTPIDVFRRLGLTRRFATAAWLGLLAPAALAATPSAKSIGCLIEPAQMALIGSPVVGVLQSVPVQRGDSVTGGQVLATLNSQVEEAALRVAQGRAELTADVLAAETNMGLATQSLTRARELEGSKYISAQTLDQLRAEHKVAEQRVAQSRDQQKIWERELYVAKAQLALRTVRSPFTGVIVDRYAEPGERVEEKPILKVAQVNPLHVELMVPSSSYGRYKLGDPITVHPDLPGADPVVAKVRRVDNIVDAASNTFRVQLNLPNPGNRLPAGLRCRVDIPVGQQLSATGGSGGAVRSSIHAP